MEKAAKVMPFSSHIFWMTIQKLKWLMTLIYGMAVVSNWNIPDVVALSKGFAANQ